jgi:hypothetical protein
MVTRSTGPNGLAIAPSSGSHLTAGSSRPSRPASRSCMIAVPVNVLVIDAMP